MDFELAELADAQHGVVSLKQLRSIGLGDSATRKRSAAGRLHRIHRGVYAVGRRRLTTNGQFMAAVLACGPKAVLSHRSATHLLSLVQSSPAATDVLVAGRSGRSHPGITVHRSATLTAADITSVDGIPCTTVARTLLDLADVVSARRLAYAIEVAERLRIYDGRAVERALDRAGRRPAATRLRRALQVYEGPPATRTELEHLALAAFTKAGLPRPLINTPVATAEGPLEVDFLWPDRALVVEADSYGWHSTRRAFEDDRRRDQLLHAAGLAVVRITWRQLAADSPRILRALAAHAAPAVQMGSRA